MINDLGYSTKTGTNGKIGLNKYLSRLDEYKIYLQENHILQEAQDIL